MNAEKLRTASLGLRLGAAFASMVVLLLVCVAFGVLRLSSLSGSMQSLLEREVRASLLSAQLDSQAQAVAKSLGQSVMADNVNEIQAHLKTVDRLRGEGAETKKSLEAALDSDSGRAALKAVADVEPAYMAATAKVIDAIKGGDSDTARLALNAKTLRDASDAYLGALTKLGAEQDAAMTAAKANAESAYANGRNLLLAAAGIAVALALVLGWMITRSVTRQLGGEPDYAASVAKRIAEGDLSVSVEVRPGDTSSLLHAMKRMADGLAETVRDIKGATDTIDTAAKEISQGNSDLSQRTEEQASSLEETASSMEELTSTVKQNAENARQANQLAVGASDVAVKGGDVVRQVVTTMSGISESSKKIADIIGTIDGIAFQTNILALNAAVEAARAGEQGRGFAVVATEVRNLAQRSAAAAKEIKELITDSVSKVDAGSQLVDDAGRTMEEIVTSVKRVTDIMAEITAASQEQSSGIEQVNQAITQMDEVTQQNAALVEEAAAAAESMQQQAQSLAQAVSVFKLSRGDQVARASQAAPKPSQTGERRGPGRAKNVARLPAKAKSMAAERPESGARTGTDDDWTEF